MSTNNNNGSHPTAAPATGFKLPSASNWMSNLGNSFESMGNSFGAASGMSFGSNSVPAATPSAESFDKSCSSFPNNSSNIPLNTSNSTNPAAGYGSGMIDVSSFANTSGTSDSVSPGRDSLSNEATQNTSMMYGF